MALAPCPFCNATPHKGPVKAALDQSGNGHQDFRIWCPKGRAKVTRPSESLAREEWNTRIAASQPDRQRLIDILTNENLAVRASYVQGYLYGEDHVVRNVLLPGPEQELSRTKNAQEHVDALARAKAAIYADAILSLLSVQVDGEQKITADNERLLSCPFCGPGNSQVDTWHDDVSKRWRVGCGRCGSSSGASVHREGSKEAAIKSWNTRNGSPPVAETKPSPSSTSATATETALRAAKRLCDNINEFGHVTDAEIFDATETAIQKALETINVA